MAVFVRYFQIQEEEEESKLPPRPADYDYYWYEDEDGNWRNEYDDMGYEFDPERYEGQEAGPFFFCLLRSVNTVRPWKSYCMYVIAANCIRIQNFYYKTVLK